MRGDLIHVRQTWQGRDYWIIKDPLTLRFFRFEEEEFALLRLLDGQRSADQIRREFADRFAPQKITNRELFQFLGSLHRSSLLITDAAGQAGQLMQRARDQRRRELKSKLGNALAIRLRGFDPDGFLNGLNRYLGWIFSPFMLGTSGLFVFSALILVLCNFELFQEKLPGFQSFFAGRNWIWLGLVLAATKVLHELGHGLACRRFGSQCHSMGIMFLVLMPCLYCDVSDSWTLKSKWQRAAIAAAGMYVEFILASLCVYLWWFSEPGWLNMLALNIVFVCSVSTLLFNANPLLKFDGYYILSDLIEVPNLRTKASSVLRRFFSRWVLGLEAPADPFMPQRHRWLFGTYSILAVLYRWLITISIFWFLYHLLEPYGLKVLGQAIAMLALWGLVGMPLVQFVRFLSVPGRINSVNRLRFGSAALIAIALLAGIFWIPVPHEVRCSFILQHPSAAKVYVEMPGLVENVHVQEAEEVVSGQPLITLANPELIEGIVLLQGEERIAEQRYDSTRQQAHYDEAAQADVDSQLASWQAISRQLQQRLHDVEQLQVRSPIAGRIMTAAYVAGEEKTDGRLTSWYGHPLEVRNRGAYLPAGTVVCQVAPKVAELEAILAIDQADIEFIQSGNNVQLWIQQQPDRLYESRIQLISTVAMSEVPKPLSSQSGGYLPTVPGPNGKQEPLSTTYQVRVTLPDPGELIAEGSIGLARIRTGNQTLGTRLWRFACKTFRFDL